MMIKKKNFWIVVSGYYLIELVLLLVSGFEMQMLIRSGIAAILFYYLYIGKKWARTVWLVLFGVSTILLTGTIVLGIMTGYEGLGILIFDVIVYAISIYLIVTIEEKDVQQKEI